MPLVEEMIHPRGLTFKMQRRVVMLRDVKGLSFPQIAMKVLNYQKEHPTAQCCSDYYDKFNENLGRTKSKYSNCGRKKWKFTTETADFIEKKLKELRKVCVCTSTTLQHALAREKGLKVSSSGVRKILLKRGYKWLNRRQKRVYSKKDMAKRVLWAKYVLRLTDAELRHSACPWTG